MSDQHPPFFRRPEVALFAAALGTYAYFFQGGGWNQNSRFNLVRAIVEQRTIVVDDYVHNTGDTAMRDGHHYSDKAPGLAILAVPVYAVVHPFAGGQRPRGRLVNAGAYLATIWAVGIPAALAVVAVYALARLAGAGAPAAAAIALAYGLASLALPYATLFYGHQLAAAMLVIAFALLAQARLGGAPASVPRLFAVGLLLGGNVAVEYPGALGLAAVSAYAAATVRPWPRLMWIALGAAVPGLALAAYHTAAWGGPLTVPYRFSNDETRHRGAFMGMSVPSPGLLGTILFSEARGLLRHAPWLALAAPGLAALARRRAVRAEAACGALASLLYLWFNASLTHGPVDWHGGWGIGPRHLVAILPFMALGVAGLFAAARGRGRLALWVVFAALVAWSAARMFVATAVRPEAPTWYDSPFHDYLFPLFRQGALGVNTIPIHTGFIHEQRQAWNLGEKMGLRGLASLAPLAAWLLAAGAWLVATLRGQREGTTS